MSTDADRQYMRQALRLAARGRGWTSPNPLVGALVVRNRRIVGRGWHPAAGQPHAEIFALREAGRTARGATLYVNLEPCNHQGRTPPCTDAIIDAGIKRVVVGMEDPNPLVAGRGIERLRAAGIEVETGVLEKECRRLNEVFCKYITSGLPFVTLKIAASLDGRIATRSGHSHWITNDKSRRFVHRLRHRHDAIMIGIGTLLQDNPRLTTRLPRGRGKNPYRVIVDSRLRSPLHANVFHGDAREKLILATSDDPRLDLGPYQDRVREIIRLPADAAGQLDLRELMRRLAAMEITSVLIEGGSEINASAIEAGIVDKIGFFYAPVLIGGRGALGMLGGNGVDLVSEGQRVTDLRLRRFGTDIYVEGYLAARDA